MNVWKKWIESDRAWKVVARAGENDLTEPQRHARSDDSRCRPNYVYVFPRDPWFSKPSIWVYSLLPSSPHPFGWVNSFNIHNHPCLNFKADFFSIFLCFLKIQIFLITMKIVHLLWVIFLILIIYSDFIHFFLMLLISNFLSNL